MSEEEKAAQLIAEAELDTRKGNRREAEQKLFQALGVANKTRNVKLANKVLSLLRDMGLFLIPPNLLS